MSQRSQDLIFHCPVPFQGSFSFSYFLSHVLVSFSVLFFSGLGSGSLNENMHCGALTGVRGPFTPSQWMELEHQALIYKYITANAPIPTNLLSSIRKSLCPTGFSGFSAGSLRPNSCMFPSFKRVLKK